MAGENDPPSGESEQSPHDPSSPKSDPAEVYKVGPGRPPKQYTWKKGGPSPNPRGRKKKAPTMAPDLKQALEDCLSTNVTVMTKDQKERTLTKGKLGIEKLVNQFAQGDRHARRDLMEYATRLGVDLLAGARKTIEALTPDHQAILDAYVARHTGKADVAPASPVIAPPELLDDDAAQPEPDQATPSTPAEPPPKNLPRTPQEIRTARLQRLKRQAEFDAARAAAAEQALASIEPTPVTPDPLPAVTGATELLPEASATHSPKPEPATAPMVPPTAPAATASPAVAETASTFSADEQSSAAGAKLSVGTATPATPPDAPPSDPSDARPLEMQNPWLQGSKPTEKQKQDWSLYINNRSQR